MAALGEMSFGARGSKARRPWGNVEGFDSRNNSLGLASGCPSLRTDHALRCTRFLIPPQPPSPTRSPIPAPNISSPRTLVPCKTTLQYRAHKHVIRDHLSLTSPPATTLSTMGARGVPSQRWSNKSCAVCSQPAHTGMEHTRVSGHLPALPGHDDLCVPALRVYPEHPGPLLLQQLDHLPLAVPGTVPHRACAARVPLVDGVDDHPVAPENHPMPREQAAVPTRAAACQTPAEDDEGDGEQNWWGRRSRAGLTAWGEGGPRTRQT